MLLRGLEAIGQFGQCRAAVSSITTNTPTATRNLENWARGLSTCQAWLTSVTVKNTSWNARIAVHWRKLRLQCLLISRFLRIGVSKSKSAGEKSRGQSFAIFCHFLATDDKAEKNSSYFVACSKVLVKEVIWLGKTGAATLRRNCFALKPIPQVHKRWHHKRWCTSLRNLQQWCQKCHFRTINEAPSDVNFMLDGSTYPGWKMSWLLDTNNGTRLNSSSFQRFFSPRAWGGWKKTENLLILKTVRCQHTQK